MTKIKLKVKETLEAIIDIETDESLSEFDHYTDMLYSLDDPSCSIQWSYNFEHISNMRKLFMYKKPKNDNQETFEGLVSKMLALIIQQKTILEKSQIN